MAINREDLFPTTHRGRKQRFFPGTIVSRLVVEKFVGKKYLPSENSYDPVYECQCECGKLALLSQQYLETRRKLKQCPDCSREISIENCKAAWEKKRRKKTGLTDAEALKMWQVPGKKNPGK